MEMLILMCLKKENIISLNNDEEPLTSITKKMGTIVMTIPERENEINEEDDASDDCDHPKSHSGLIGDGSNF